MSYLLCTRTRRMLPCVQNKLVVAGLCILLLMTALGSAATCEDADKANVKVARSSLHVKPHSTAELECSWSYIETVSGVEWYFNDSHRLARVHKVEHNKTTCLGKDSYLIKNFTASDVGNYTCKVYTEIDLSKPFIGRISVFSESPNVTLDSNPTFEEKVPNAVVPVIATGIVVPLLILTAVIGLIVCLKLKFHVILKDDYEAMSQPGRDGFKYDLFVSYRDSRETLSFVMDHVKSPLEAAGHHVCHHKEDFIAGMEISENITECMDQSRMILLVLTKDFTDSKWSMFELNYAVDRMREQRTRCLLPAAWNQKDVPRQLKKLTFLKIVDDKEREFTEQLIKILGDPVPGT